MTPPEIVDGLAGDTPYTFTIQAQNINGWGPESAPIGLVSPQGALVADAGPDQNAVARNTLVTLTGAGSTSGAVCSWTQLNAAGGVLAADSPNRVTLTGADTTSPTFTLPLYRFPMTNGALRFSIEITKDGNTKTDEVVVSPRSDVVTVGAAKWKARDFRVIGTAVVTAAALPEVDGVWSLRVRAGAGLPTANPGLVFADSNQGGTAGPTVVVNG